MRLNKAVSVSLATALLAAGCAMPAWAQLKVEVTNGVTDPVPVAIVPFAKPGTGDSGLDVASVIEHDLQGSGRFRTLPRTNMPATPTQPNAVVMGDWKNAGEDYIVVGRVVPLDGGNLAVDFDLLNVLTGQRVAGQRFTGTPSALRNAAHRVSDVVFEKILGIRGAFATRIAYVSVDGQPPAQKFQLIVADADGENQRLVLESRYPLMSPSWSPDGQWLAYVSFENKRSAVYVQFVRTGERRQVSARAGINGAPVWSPDGKKLALTLGGSSGNPDIYTLELQTQNLTRLTDDPSIDTEPAWAPDGKSIYFTSDRAGGPQIYRIGVNPGDRPKRITFTGNYNARPRVSADGNLLAVVTQDSGNYRVAVQDLNSGTFRVLSKGHLDESPSFAPNGSTIMFSEREGNRGILATVSVDGLIGLRLKSDQGEVREPAWGPFAQWFVAVWAVLPADQRVDKGMRKILMVLMLATALVSAGGCASKKPKPGASQSTEVGSNNGADSAGAGSDAANAGNVGADNDVAGPQGGLLAKRVIYFDFDSSDIKGEGNDVVAAHAKYLASHASTRVRLEGNTDDRGSREYNIGLGERRAQSVRRALMLQGATEGQVSTVSYGAERPAVVGNDEGAWSKNRRVEIVYLGPGGQAAPVQPQPQR